MRRSPMLRTFAMIVISALGCVVVSGCVADMMDRVMGSGNLKTEPREIGQFNQVRSEGAADVAVTIGQPQSITVTADDNILPLIETKVDGQTLVLTNHGHYSTRNGVKVAITCASMKDVDLTGSGNIDVNGIDE